MRLTWLSLMLDSLAQGFLDRPSQDGNAGEKSLFVYAGSHCPLCESHSSPPETYPVIITLVVALLFYGTPFYITRKIASIIVNTFKGVFGGGSWAKMFIEIGKRYEPFIAHGYPSPPISRERFIFGVETSRLHAFPDYIFRKFGFAMSKIAKFSLFPTKTPTAFYTAAWRTQICPSDNCGVPAKAHTLPEGIGILACMWMPTDYRKAAKYLTCKIDGFRHNASSWLKAMMVELGYAGRQATSTCLVGCTSLSSRQIVAFS